MLVAAQIARRGSRIEGHLRTLLIEEDHGDTFDHVIERVRDLIHDNDDLIHVAIRTNKFPTHPFVCEWTRKWPGEPWSFKWNASWYLPKRTGPDPVGVA